MWLAGRKIAKSVTSTKNSGNTEKNAQNAIIAARFADWSSENFLTVAIATAEADAILLRSIELLQDVRTHALSNRSIARHSARVDASTGDSEQEREH